MIELLGLISATGDCLYQQQHVTNMKFRGLIGTSLQYCRITAGVSQASLFISSLFLLNINDLLDDDMNNLSH